MNIITIITRENGEVHIHEFRDIASAEEYSRTRSGTEAEPEILLVILGDRCIYAGYLNERKMQMAELQLLLEKKNSAAMAEGEQWTVLLR